jgi:tryptophan halogenase
VYSSAFLSDDAAEDELRGFLGRDRVKELRFDRIRIRAGRHERAWVKNCVAIGVSFGFLEPLESTGLSLTQVVILDLEKALAQGGTSVAKHWFNRRCTEIFDATRDFVTAHFVLTQREDTACWRHIRYASASPDSLADVIERASTDHSFKPIEGLRNTFYEELNWKVILSGMGPVRPGARRSALVQPSRRYRASCVADGAGDPQ